MIYRGYYSQAWILLESLSVVSELFGHRPLTNWLRLAEKPPWKKQYKLSWTSSEDGCNSKLKNKIRKRKPNNNN